MPAPPPHVSVCIPTYNYGRFVADAVRSVLAQTRGDFELVVVDNLSTDGTEEVVAPFLADPRVRYVRNERNLGMGGNWNRCLELARCDAVKILCADDVLDPRCLELSLAALEADPALALVATGRTVADERLEPIRTVAFARGAYSRLSGREALRRCLVRGNLIGEPTAVTFRRSAARRGFLPEYKQLTDLEFWFHLLERGDFLALPEPLCSLRQHGSQETRANALSLEGADDEFRLFDAYAGKRELGLSAKDRLLGRFGRALEVWKFQAQGADTDAVLERIGRHMNLFLFAFLHFLYITKNILSRRRR